MLTASSSGAVKSHYGAPPLHLLALRNQQEIANTTQVLATMDSQAFFQRDNEAYVASQGGKDQPPYFFGIPPSAPIGGMVPLGG
ncbi:hypothetical protein GOP47_0026355 [Adiantum capillus-veneris]|nr:hypothetical protein GOP47_0026355 [Adiantum capillus-veneris]